MSDVILKATDITKRFTEPAPLTLLKGISLEVRAGESVAIVGKSGEGKTTLLHILGTIDEPTTGEISLAGQKVSRENSDELRKKHLGFVFQAFHLLEDATVLENLLLPLSIARKPLKQHLPRALDLLHRLGLHERKDLHALKLSGGEKQRLGIARAFITNPDLIFADEPTGNLDHETAQEIQSLLFSWVKSENKALILVTHSPTLARQTTTRYTLESGLLLPDQSQ